MERTVLDKGLFFQCIRYACHFLIEKKEAINAINVFPVADGDTGDNMAATARAIILHAKEEEGLLQTAQSIADASVLGARGNSGMIFSQFFNGLADAIPTGLSITTSEFSRAVHQACEMTRAAILNPVEGTILSLMEQWSESLEMYCKETLCFDALLNLCFPAMEENLQATTNCLDVLKDAHVVDAGALGFYHFVHGFAARLNDASLTVDMDILSEEGIQHERPKADTPPNKRYCTEAILSAETLDKTILAKMLQRHGDSIVISSNPRLCRFHVHSDAPWELFAELQHIGRIQYPKVDDMLRQYQAAHHRKYPVALVCDSSADFPQALMEQHQIHSIPVNVHFDEHDLLDRLCLTSATLYDQLEQTKQYPTTSCPSPGLVKTKLSGLAEQYQEVLVISIAQALSATYDALANGAESFNNVTVIDSRQVSGGIGLLLGIATKMLDEGCEPKNIIAALERRRSNIKLFVMVEKFDSLIRSGRVSKLKGAIASVAGIKPIVSLDVKGKGYIYDKAFSSRKALTKIVDTVLDIAKKTPLEAYGIVHAAAPEQAQQFAELTRESFGQDPLFIEPVSTAIGLHAGKGCVGINCLFADTP